MVEILCFVNADCGHMCCLISSRTFVALVWQLKTLFFILSTFMIQSANLSSTCQQAETKVRYLRLRYHIDDFACNFMYKLLKYFLQTFYKCPQQLTLYITRIVILFSTWIIPCTIIWDNCFYHEYLWYFCMT